METWGKGATLKLPKHVSLILFNRNQKYFYASKMIIECKCVRFVLMMLVVLSLRRRVRGEKKNDIKTILPPSGNISPFGRKRYVRKYKPFRECSDCFIHQQCNGCNQSHQISLQFLKKQWQLGYCFHFRCFISTKCCFVSEDDC